MHKKQNHAVTSLEADNKITSMQVNARQIIRDSMPPTLYKFYPCNDNNFDALEKQQIWLSHPQFFNDPFDANHLININRLRDGLNAYKNSSHRLGKFWNTVLSHLQMRSTHSFNEHIQQAKKIVTKWVKITCFSETYKNPLLWAHYAEGHKGYVVGFKKSDLCQHAILPVTHKYNDCPMPFFDLLPVVYDNSRHDCTENYLYFFREYLNRVKRKKAQEQVITYKDALKFSECFLFKSKSWEYENEWRLLRFSDDLADFESHGMLVTCKPSEIYLGCKMSSLHKRHIESIVHSLNQRRDYGKKIQVFELHQPTTNPSKGYSLIQRG